MISLKIFARAFGARILTITNYIYSYDFIYHYQIFLCNYQPLFMEKNQEQPDYGS